RRGREGHACGPDRRRGDLHGAARGAAGADVVAVADAALRRAADRRAVLPAARHRAGAPRVEGRPGMRASSVSAASDPIVPSDAAPVLAVQDLAVRFGGVAALADVSFDVARATVTSLIGPNGAGKTTAFNAITGFQRPAAGRVSHEGVAIT